MLKNDYFSFCENVYYDTQNMYTYSITKYQQYLYLDAGIIDRFYSLVIFFLIIRIFSCKRVLLFIIFFIKNNFLHRSLIGDIR